MERRVQNSLWARGAALTVALLLGTLRPIAQGSCRPVIACVFSWGWGA